MELISKNIQKIHFWRRSVESVEKIQYLTISPLGDAFIVQIDKDTTKLRTISSNEVDAILKQLEQDCHLSTTPDEYRAFQYENEKNDFSLKFFLEIDYINFTYFALKGIHPFKQPYYKEIVTLFDSLFD